MRKTDLLWLLMLFAFASQAAADGKKAFIEKSCNRCHAVAAEGIEATAKSERMRGPDLSSVGKERDAAWLARYLEKEVELDGKAHRPSFKGTDEELQAIADWLSKLDGSD